MKQDNFELIAQDAVKALTSVILTLHVCGKVTTDEAPGLAQAIAHTTEGLIDRAIALGGH